jgi:anti-sigma factor (TIGR02949 family)
MGTLNDVLDGEAQENEVQHFHDHIDKCKPCFEHYHIDKSVKEVLKYKIENKEIPTTLIDSIKSKIKHEC